MQGNELVNTRLSKKVKLVFSILRVVLKSSLSGDLEFANLLKVKSFLDSIGRNSIKSKTSYFTGLRHLHNFVTSKYPEYNCESILEPLANNQINVYELLDSFISNLLEERKGITPKSLSLYVTTIRSYFAYYDIDVLPSKQPN
jgi:hypothetical protein